MGLAVDRPPILGSWCEIVRFAPDLGQAGDVQFVDHAILINVNRAVGRLQLASSELGRHRTASLAVMLSSSWLGTGGLIMQILCSRTSRTIMAASRLVRRPLVKASSASRVIVVARAPGVP